MKVSDHGNVDKWATVFVVTESCLDVLQFGGPESIVSKPISDF